MQCDVMQWNVNQAIREEKRGDKERIKERKDEKVLKANMGSADT